MGRVTVFVSALSPGPSITLARNLPALSGGVVDKKRKDDLEKQAHFRTDRMINHNGKWFFCTRESTIQGPFEDQLEASYRLKRYIDVSASGLAGELTLVPIEPIA